MYEPRGVFGHSARVGWIELTLGDGINLPVSRYHVYGTDRARVDAIANRIEEFARRAGTGRSAAFGHYVDVGTRAFALMLIPFSLIARERRRAWLLFLASGALFFVAFALPVGALFPSLVIEGTR